jgi:arylsulfatase A-like enzyme
MHKRTTILLLLSLLSLSLLSSSSQLAAKRPPNFVIIFMDDMGYADIGSFGAKGYTTPNLDRMAREGMRLTNFYAAQAVCTASRAALMTGCYSNRVGLTGALFPNAASGINAAEMTVAEILKTRGYATGIFGKWHLGDKPQFMPVRHGFDEYFGIPYSNDMWPPNNRNFNFPPLPLIENDKVVKEVTADVQPQLTTLLTERAVQFIERNITKPFFLYLPHPMPHVPIFASGKFKGKTERGLYGDVIEEIDWSVGQILAALKNNGLDDNTLVIFTSDNGPWAEYGDHAGSAGPLRGSKQTAFEGGQREPFIARWPKKIPAGSVSYKPLMTIDLLPTLAKLAGAQLPQDHIIDGRDLWPVLSGKQKKGEVHDALYFYWGYELHAVLSGKWKLHVPHPSKVVIEPGHGGQPGRSQPIQVPLSLFDLERDVGETTNVADQNREVVQQLMKFVERARADLGDSLTKREGKNVRPAGK